MNLPSVDNSANDIIIEPMFDFAFNASTDYLNSAFFNYAVNEVETTHEIDTNAIKNN